MNIANLEVLKGLVAKKNAATPQLIQVSVETPDISSSTAYLRWYNVDAAGKVDEPFAGASLYYGDAEEWLSSWVPVTHLIQGRINDLERLADEGIANRFSHNYAYLLFANNLVDYASKYRGMQSVILNGLEAVADVVLTEEKSGTWTVPPYFIDSVAHLAGFIMNVSDAIDTKANFCVTPGWSSMRFARPLVPGGRYRSYTKMIPTAADPSVYLGDVYILQDDAIVGMVGGIKFRRYPRILLNRFFSAPDDEGPKAHGNSAGASAPLPVVTAAAPAPKTTLLPVPLPVVAGHVEKVVRAEMVVPAVPPAALTKAAPVAPVAAAEGSTSSADSTSAKAIALIAEEAALEISDLQDDASFANLGIDSLMSLVLAEKFREELGVTVGGSLFLEYPTVGDLRAWLTEYYS